MQLPNQASWINLQRHSLSDKLLRSPGLGLPQFVLEDPVQRLIWAFRELAVVCAPLAEDLEVVDHLAELPGRSPAFDLGSTWMQWRQQRAPCP